LDGIEEIIMTRTTWLASFVTALALALPAWAEAPPTADNPGTGDDIKRQLDDVRTMIRDTMRAEIGTLKIDQQVANEALRARLKQMEDQLESLKTQVRALENKMETTTRISAASPAGAAALSPAPATARLRFLNEFVTDMTVTVNGRSYLVPFGQVIDVPTPAGAAIYQVLGADLAPNVRTLAANEVLSVRIFPRQS
jgi:hypothetical protein